MVDNNNEKNRNQSSFFNDKPKVPPLEERTDKYSQTKLKAKRLIEIFDKYK